MKQNQKLSKDVSYWKFFSQKSELIKLIGITSFGIMASFQYFTFVILSEKLGAFTIQQRNYVFLYSKIMGRASFFCVLLFATRRFLNFLISSVILVLSIGIFIISLNFSQESTNLLGIVFTGNKDSFIICSIYLPCGKLPYGTRVPVHN